MHAKLRFIPVIILWGIGLRTAYAVFFQHIVFLPQHITGYLLLLTATILMVVAPKIGDMALGICLVAATLNAVQYTYVYTNTSMEIELKNIPTGLSYSIQPYMGWLLILYMIINYKTIRGWIKDEHPDNDK
jgi:hypothetical protein